MIQYKGCSVSKHVKNRVTLMYKCIYSLNATKEEEEQAEFDSLTDLARHLGGTMTKSDRYVPGWFDVMIHFDLAALAFPDTTEGNIFPEEVEELKAELSEMWEHTAPKIKELLTEIILAKQPIREVCQSCSRCGTDSLLCHTCLDGSNKEEIAYYEPIEKVVEEAIAESKSKDPCVCDFYHSHGRCKLTCPLPHAKPITKDFQNEEYRQMVALMGKETATGKIDDDIAAHRILEYYQIFRKELPPEEAAQLLNVVVNNLL